MQNYPTLDDGLTATVNTLTLPYYVAVVAAVEGCEPVGVVAPLIEASPWGTRHVIRTVTDAMRDFQPENLAP